LPFAFGAFGTTAYIATRDTAGTWHAVASPTGLSTGQAWYDWFVAVQPDNANTVYLGAIDIHRGDHGAGGWTWTDISAKAGAASQPQPGDHRNPVYRAGFRLRAVLASAVDERAVATEPERDMEATVPDRFSRITTR
jgi:hypothetical protein